MDRAFKRAKAETCTFWTRTYPMREFTIYAVGEGEKQYLRMMGGGCEATYNASPTVRSNYRDIINELAVFGIISKRIYHPNEKMGFLDEYNFTTYGLIFIDELTLNE